MFDALKGNKLSILIIALIIGLACGLLIANVSGPSVKQTAQLTARVEEVIGEKDIRNAFIEVAGSVGPAVVSIYTETTRKVAMRGFPQGPRGGAFRNEFFEEFFKDFFRDYPEREYKQSGMGSGVIIDKEGYILTNEHVIGQADKITVALSDGREFQATVKGTDARSDLAVIKISASDLPVAELGDSDLIQIGEWVVAIGNPFGAMMRSPEPTVTTGVVSALHRSLPRRLPGHTDLIQTDAAINPGNSGGPLCDLNGRVIGINVAMFSQSGGYQGVGFAIPSNYVKESLGDLIEGKEILHGWLGVSVQDLTQDLADYFGIADRKGVLIAGVAEEGPAKKAGVKEGDVVTSFNAKKIKDVNELLRAVNLTRVGKTVKLEIVRDKKNITISTKIAERPSGIDKPTPVDAETEMGNAGPWRGITASTITEAIAQQLRLMDTAGVVVIDVEMASPANIAGMKKGDVIRGIGKKTIKTVEDFAEAVKSLKGDVLIRADRGYIIIKEK